jgi:hypothetical protein
MMTTCLPFFARRLREFLGGYAVRPRRSAILLRCGYLSGRVQLAAELPLLNTAGRWPTPPDVNYPAPAEGFSDADIGRFARMFPLAISSAS